LSLVLIVVVPAVVVVVVVLVVQHERFCATSVPTKCPL
jgi:hypothetical protein